MGRGKQKRTPKKLQFGGCRTKKRKDWSDSDSDRPVKKRKRKELPAAEIDRGNIVESRGRRTRGVKVNYSLLEGSSDEDPEAGKGKGKGPRKWDGSEDEFKPESDAEKPEEAAGEEDGSEEEVNSEDMSSEDMSDSQDEKEE